MDLRETINSSDDIRALIDTYRRAVHGDIQQSQQILEKHPELRHAVSFTRGEYDRSDKLGREWERLAVEGILELGNEVLKEKARSRPAVPTSIPALPMLKAESEKRELGDACLDIGREINSEKDIRLLVDAYRRALHGNEQVSREVFDSFPGIEPLVGRTKDLARQSGTPLEDLEQVGVEGIVERGLRVLAEKGCSPFRAPELSPESYSKAAPSHSPMVQLLAYVGGDKSQLDPAQRAEVMKSILSNISQQAGVDKAQGQELS